MTTYEDEYERPLRTHCRCDDCGSSDAKAYWANSSHCFSCKKSRRLTEDEADEVLRKTSRMNQSSVPLLYGVTPPDNGLRKRGLTPETLRKFRYGTVRVKRRRDTGVYYPATEGGELVQVAQYDNAEGEIIGQKLRFKDKSQGLPWVGTARGARLFGMHLWPAKGRKIVITEGEIDAMSFSQIQQHRWPVVSLINGASGAVRDLSKNLERLAAYEEVVLMFDNDEKGMEAAQECAEQLSAHLNIKIARLPSLEVDGEYLKDANDFLRHGKITEITQAMWDAAPYVPEGVVSAQDYREEYRQGRTIHATTWAWPCLSKGLLGLRTGEVTAVIADTGVGKTAFVVQQMFDLIEKKEPVGAIFLEQDGVRTMDGILGLHLGRRLHLERALSMMPDEIKALRPDIPEFDQELVDRTYDELFAHNNFHMDTHWGSENFDKLLFKIKHMIVAEGCKWIFLDHISMAVAGSDITDERKALDMAMEQITQIVNGTGATVFVVCHLRRPGGSKSFDEGLDINLTHIRGTQGIAQMSYTILALQRPKLVEELRDYTQVVCLKDRFAGDADGTTVGWLQFDKETGRLEEVAEPACLQNKDSSTEDKKLAQEIDNDEF